MRHRSLSREPANLRPDQNAKRIREIISSGKLYNNGFMDFPLANETFDKTQVRSTSELKSHLKRRVRRVSRETIVNLHSEVLGVNPYVIGMTYLRYLATRIIPVTGVQLNTRDGKFGAVVLDSNIEKIEKKLNALKTQRSHQNLSGVLYVKSNYDIPSTKRGKRLTVDKIEAKTGALHIGSEESPLLERADELQRTSSPAALVAHRCIGFSIHSPGFTTGRKFAEDLNLYTCLTRHDEVVFTARSFADIKTITYSILKISDVVTRRASFGRRASFVNLPSLPSVIVGLGFDDSSYEFDKVLFELGQQLDGHTVTYIFKSEEIALADARNVMETEENWEQEMRTQRGEDNFKIKPYTTHAIHKWQYALTCLEGDLSHGVENVEYKNEKSLHSLTFPIPKLPGKCIQVTNHASNEGHLFQFAEEVERIVQTFVNPVNQN